jgi:hypothetical protein
MHIFVCRYKKMVLTLHFKTGEVYVYIMCFKRVN